MVQVGGIIEVTFSEDNKQCYFRTEKSEKRHGVEYQMFCACKPAEDIEFTDFWGISEAYYKQMEEKGMLRKVA